MQTIQIDDQVFDVLQRAAALLVEPSPNAVLRRMLLADPVLAALPETSGPSPFAAPAPAPPRPSIPLGTIPPPRAERAPALPPALMPRPAWKALSEVTATTPRIRSVAAAASRLPPGLRQALDVIHLIVRHRVPRPEAIRRVSDLRRASGAPTDGPRLTLTASEFDRMLKQRGRADLRRLLKETFPGYDDAIDGFFDELTPRRQPAETA